jgi:hypothetical protein
LKQVSSARTVLVYARALAVAALLGAIGSPGCGSTDGVVTGGDGGATEAGPLDEAGPEDLDAGPEDIDGPVVTSLDAKPPQGDAKVSAADAHPAAYVSLGAAADFVVLSGETITNTGFTIINGNVGLSPGSALTGFPPGVINGVVHASDAVAATAKKALNDAYIDAKGRSGAPIPLVGDLGGMTLGPGLYFSSTSMALDGGDVTLDGGGDQDAIWVFQITSTFVAMVGRKVILINNAKPDNVFWNVSSSATIGVGVSMVGNFLTDTSITVQTGASMEGRFLTQIGSVTFDSNNINKPKPIR